MPRSLKLVVAIAIIAAAIVIIRSLPVGAELTRFQGWVRDQGALGYIVYALVYAVSVVFLVPGSILTIGAGVIFGVAGGTVVVIAGATLGATIAFLLARGMMRDRVAGWTRSDQRFQAIDAAVGREGAKIVLLVRLSVIFPFSWVNYAFGITSVPTAAYVLATLVGIVPATVAFVYIGAAAGQAVMASHLRAGIYVLGAIAALGVSIYVGRLAARAFRDAR